MSYQKIIDHIQTDYNDNLTIAKTTDGKFLLLLQGEDEVGAVNLEHPDRIYGYSEVNYNFVKALNPEITFMIGHGIGMLTKKLNLEGIPAKVVEIDAKMVELSKKYFGFTGNNVVIGDGFEVIKHEPDEFFNCIVMDAFLDAQVPEKFINVSFFKTVCQKLTPDGHLIMNHVGRRPEIDEWTRTVESSIRSFFPFVKRYTNVREPDKRGNFLYIAGHQEFTHNVETKRFFQG